MYRLTMSRVPLKTKDYSTKQFDHNYSADTDREEGTGTSQIGRGHWVTDTKNYSTKQFDPNYSSDTDSGATVTNRGDY